MRRPALTARSTCSRPWVSTRPPGSKTRIFRRCGYSAARRPRLSHMLPMTPSISGSESPGKARLMLRRACRVTGRRGPMARPSAPPKADAQSSGKTLNTLNKNAAPQATSRSATLGVLVERFGAGFLARGINCAIQAEIRFRRRRLSRSLCQPLRVAPVRCPTRLRSRNCRKDSRCLRLRAAAVHQFEASAPRWGPREHA